MVYEPKYFDEVKVLWQEAFPNDPPWNAAELAIPEKVAVQPELFLVALDSNKVVGFIMAGYDGHRSWLYTVAVLKSRQRRSIGSTLVRHMEQLLQEKGGKKINLQVRATNSAVVDFYKTLGYEIEERVSLGKRLPPIRPRSVCGD